MSDVLVMNGLGTTPLTPVYAALEARNVAGSYVWQNPIARLGFEACATDALAGCFAENAPLSPAPRHPYLGGIVTGAALMLVLGRYGKWIPLGLGGYLLLERLRA